MNRDELVAVAAEAMERADEEFLVDWDCMANETVVDWTGLATAAVDAVLEVLGPPF